MRPPRANGDDKHGVSAALGTLLDHDLAVHHDQVVLTAIEKREGGWCSRGQGWKRCQRHTWGENAKNRKLFVLLHFWLFLQPTPNWGKTRPTALGFWGIPRVSFGSSFSWKNRFSMESGTLVFVTFIACWLDFKGLGHPGGLEK